MKEKEDNKNYKVETGREDPKPKVAVSFDKSFDSDSYKNNAYTKTFISWERLIPVLQLALGTNEKPKGVIIDRDGLDVILK